MAKTKNKVNELLRKRSDLWYKYDSEKVPYKKAVLEMKIDRVDSIITQTRIIENKI